MSLLPCFPVFFCEPQGLTEIPIRVNKSRNIYRSAWCARLSGNVIRKYFGLFPALPGYMIPLTCYVSGSLRTFPSLLPYCILVSSVLRGFRSSVLTREGPVASKLLVTPLQRNVEREQQAVWLLSLDHLLLA